MTYFTKGFRKFFSKNLFSDEAHFENGGYINKQNVVCGIYEQLMNFFTPSVHYDNLV